MYSRVLSHWIHLILLLALVQTGVAQDVSLPSPVSGAAQYTLGDKDQILMSVNVWGFVSKPGQYVVPRNTDLLSLISFAGGPTRGANLSKVSIVRTGALIRADVASKEGGPAFLEPAGKVPILEVDIKRHLASGEVGKIPILSAGDTILIPETGGSKFSKLLGLNSVVSIITALASVAIILERTK